jgi:AraC family transcriptional regulator
LISGSGSLRFNIYCFQNTNILFMQTAVEYIRQFPRPDNFDDSEERWNHSFQNAFVVINGFSSNIYYPEHWTPLSVKCAFNGKEHYRFSNKAYTVSDQSFLLLNEDNVYASYIHSETRVESLSLNFTKNNIETANAAYCGSDETVLDNPLELTGGNLNFYDKLNEYTPGFLHCINLFRKQLQQPVVNKMALSELMYSALGELIQIHKLTSSETDKIDAKKRSTRVELYQRLSIAKDYMHSCYAENISLDLLARISLLNPAYLLREFKKLFGLTPHQYLTVTRLAQAEELVIGTNKSVSEILAETGFIDLSSFSKLFKRRFGLSPQAYRLFVKK